MKIVIGADHGGVETKKEIIKHLSEIRKIKEILDIGTHSTDSVNYAEFGIEVAEIVANKEADLGIVVCSTGEGISIAANKVKGIRCGLIYDDESARLTKEHNNCNVVSFGAKTMSVRDIISRLDIFLSAKFEGGRHQVRLDYISQYEND